MPGTKRSSKVLSYNEQDDDDDDFIPTKKIDCKPPPKPEPASEEVSSESSTSSHDTKCSEVVEQNENSSPEISQNDTEEEFSSIPVEKPAIPPVATTRRHSTVPLGFPTSKINIPSPHVSRVGLSRKSLPAKSLHPNLASRVHPD